MKITRRQLRQIIKEQGNPGSKFGAAKAAGDKDADEKATEEINKELQKTVDWFDSVVFPAIEKNDWPIKVDDNYYFSMEDEFGHQDLALNKGQSIQDIQTLLNCSSSSEDVKYRIGDIYRRMEKEVIHRHPGVNMESDAGKVMSDAEKKEKAEEERHLAAVKKMKPPPPSNVDTVTKVSSGDSVNTPSTMSSDSMSESKKITRRQLRQIISEAFMRNPDEIDSQDMADAKRYAGDSVESMAAYLGIGVEDWRRIRSELDDHYEDRHMDDQEAFDHYPKILGYIHPETGAPVMINVQSRDDMDDILDPLLRQYPDLAYSID